MSAHGTVNLAFGDGRYDFNIALIGPTLELQDKCGGAGVGTIFMRLRTSTFFYNDFRETIRLALIGGGMKPVDAIKLVERYVDARPWNESVLTATAIISAAMVGVPDEKVGKENAGQTVTGATTGALSDPPSMASEQPSDSIPEK